MSRLLTDNDRFPRWRSFAGTLLLAMVTLATYLPAYQAGYVWDDSVMTADAVVRADDGLRRIWFTTEPADYFPLTYSMFWLEYRMWEPWRGGPHEAVPYHVVNVVLHTLGSLLLWRTLRQLRVPGAFAAAMIFAVHPVNVASVAWIAERKNTLSLVFYMLAALAYFKFDDADNTKPRWAWYVVTIIAFLLALLSKTSTVMLPPVLLVLMWWRHRRVTLRHAVSLAPLFLLSLVLGLVTRWFQKYNAIGEVELFAGSFPQRAIEAGWSVWFYLYKAVVPVRLTMIYPRWDADVANPLHYVPAIALLALAVLFWFKRETWGRHALTAMGCFVVTLFPVLGFFDMAFMSYSKVADHWQYLAIVGVIVPIVALAAVFCRSLAMWPIGVVVTIAVVSLLSVMSFRQARLFQDEQTLWTHNIAVNPKAWGAYTSLGRVRLDQGRLNEALNLYRDAIALHPHDAKAFLNMGLTLARMGLHDDAMRSYQHGLSLDRQPAPTRAQLYNNLGTIHLRQENLDLAREHFAQAVHLAPDAPLMRYNLALVLYRLEQWSDARRELETALARSPGYQPSLILLASTLAQQGLVSQAIEQFEKVLAINPDHADTHYDLANLHWKRGDSARAIAHFRRAHELNPALPWPAERLARILATDHNAQLRDGREALRLAELACQATQYRQPVMLDTLAAAQAELGLFDDAAVTARRAAELAEQNGMAALAAEIREHQTLYENRRPLRLAPPGK